MSKVYFIDSTYVTNSTPINLNVEPQLLNSAIIEAQIIHIQSVIGTKLYKKMEQLITGATMATAGNYKILMDDYIRPSLVHWSLYECIPYVHFKIMNKGVVNQNSDNSTSSDLEEIKFLQQQIKNKAEFITQRLVDYLISNMSLFPEYTTNNDYDEMQPSGNAYFSGLVLDDDYDCERFLGKNDRTKSII